MRIYLPATLDELDAVTVTADAARWTVAPRGAHAVTAALTRALPDEDEEGLEYAAALEAADDSLALVAARPDAPRQRLVVTLEVPDGAVQVVGGDDSDDEDAPAPSAVEVLRTVPDVAIVCVHVDEPEAVEDVEAVLAAADDDGPGADEALDAAIDRVGERDLLWYDWSELKDVPRG
ncbi:MULTISPECIES: DUF6912 family protein [Cellulosimicrobium]|uniref:Uncharacterized protein n=1 Tax=Cellulosimicrobium sp. ES-005 TaxID=3163031 RepID=A0AAU8G441_9MICO|nr:hypothetical protein [Cellulosimicrobium cellulans]MCO7274351.1 hypothetical protein [Cellulosimicrobium cellulans]